MLNNLHHQKKFNLIQAFRGLAALLVLLCHANDIFNRELNQDFLFNIFGFGWAGVDFFFVLSGFIIFYIHKSDIGHPNRYKSFFFKRFIRVYPLYWIILSGKIAASLFLAYGGDIHQRSLGEIIKAFLLFPQESDILVTSFVGVSWTLSHEILFYLMFSLLIMLKAKLSIPIIIVWLIGTFLNFIGVIELFKESFLLNFLFNERNLEFVLGCLSAYLVFNYRIKYGIILTYLATFLFTLSAILSNYRLFTGVSPVIYFGIPCVLLIVGAVSLEISKSIKVPYIFIYIGNSSYSIYLMHGVIISNIVKIISKLKFDSVSQNPLILNVIGILIAVITIGCGCIVYSYIEKPLLSTLRLKLATAKSNNKVSNPPLN